MKFYIFVFSFIAFYSLGVEVDVVVDYNGATRGSNTISSLSSGTYGWHSGWYSEDNSDRWTVEERLINFKFPITITHSNVTHTGEGTNWIVANWQPGYGDAGYANLVFAGGYSAPIATNAIIAGFVNINLTNRQSSTDLVGLSDPTSQGFAVMNYWGGYVRAHAQLDNGSSTYGSVASTGSKTLWYTLLHRSSASNAVVKVWDASSNYNYLGISQAGVKYIGRDWRLVFKAAYLYQYMTNVRWGPFVVKYNPSQSDIAALEPWVRDSSYLQSQIDATPTNGTLDISDTKYSLDSQVSIDGKAMTILGNSETWITNTVTGSTGSGVDIGEFAALVIRATTNGLIKIKGVNFYPSANTNHPNYIYSYGPAWSPVWITECKFYKSGHAAVSFGGMIAGLVNSNQFENCMANLSCYAWGYGSSDIGLMNHSWTNPLTLGTTNTIVIEDNVINYTESFTDSGIGVAMNSLGARSAFRFNKVTNYLQEFMRVIDAHGNGRIVDTNIQPETSGLTNTHRGTRQLEDYGNFVISKTNGGLRLSDYRGGTVYNFSNNYWGSSIEYGFYCREEDSPVRYSFLTNYPGYDQHWLWIWESRVNGNVVSNLYHQSYEWDPIFIRWNTNVFYYHPPYVPLVYPHPLAGGQAPTPPEPPSTNSIKQGYMKNVKLSGRYFIQ